MGSNTLRGTDIRAPILAFLPASILFGATTILLWLTLLQNEPFWNSGTPTVPVSAVDNYAWLFTLNTTSPGGQIPGRGFVKYGFGVWGWCEWGNSVSELKGDAVCYGGGDWSAPFDSGLGSQVDTLDLPNSVSRAMFPCGVLIVLAVMPITLVFLLHLGSMRFKYAIPQRSWSFNEIKSHLRKSGGSKRFFCAALIINRWMMVLTLASLIVGCVPALACAVDAVKHYRGIRGIDYTPRLGLGATYLIACLAMEPLGVAWVWYGGLWYHKSLKSQRSGSGSSKA